MSATGGDDESAESTDSEDKTWTKTHTDLVEALAMRLKCESATVEVYTEKDYDGVVVDIVQVLASGQVALWEVKTPGVQPGCKTVYHLLMYHDHYVRHNREEVQSVNLLSDSLSGNGKSDLKDLDGRSTPMGGDYCLNHVDLKWVLEDVSSDSASIERE